MSAPFGDALVECAAAVRTKADFVSFVQLLLRNYREHPEEWENATLEAFLGGLCGFVAGAEGYYANIGARVDLEAPGWRALADALLAARVYE